MGKLRNKEAIKSCHSLPFVCISSVAFQCLARLLGIEYKVKQLDLYNLRDTKSPKCVGLNPWDVPLPLRDYFQVFVSGWTPM